MTSFAKMFTDSLQKQKFFYKEAVNAQGCQKKLDSQSGFDFAQPDIFRKTLF